MKGKRNEKNTEEREVRKGEDIERRKEREVFTIVPANLNSHTMRTRGSQ